MGMLIVMTEGMRAPLSESLEAGTFECTWNGLSVCMNKTTKQCNGVVDCEDRRDESPSVCENCDSDPGILRCKYDGHTVCLNRTTQQCNGEGVCDNGSDEATSLCGQCLDPEKKCLNSEKKCLDPEKFECEWYGRSVCVNKKDHKCNGIADCDDGSDEFPSLCGQCQDSYGKFECKWYGQSVCLKKSKYQCDGRIDDCDDGVDELPALCGNCDHPDKFECKINGQSFCLSKAKYQCDGIIDCEDGSDEHPSVCDECSGENLDTMCKTSGSQCVQAFLFIPFFITLSWYLNPSKLICEF